METFDFVLRKAGIAYEIIPLNTSVFGASDENGSWSGYLGIMQQVERVLQRITKCDRVSSTLWRRHLRHCRCV